MVTDPSTSAARRVSWRDSFATWPSLRVTVELLPWHWRFRWHRDDIEYDITVEVGPVRVEMFASRKPFSLEYVDASPRTGG